MTAIATKAIVVAAFAALMVVDLTLASRAPRCILYGSYKKGDCVPLAMCPSLDKFAYHSNECLLAYFVGGTGVCCSKIDDPRMSDVQRQQFASSTVQGQLLADVDDDNDNDDGAVVVELSADELGIANANAIQLLADSLELEQILLERGFVTDENSAEARHNRITMPEEATVSLRGPALVAIETTKQISSGKAIQKAPSGLRTKSRLSNFVVNVSTTDASSSSFCPKPTQCVPSQHYSVDGSCNNLKNGDWGKSFRVFQRLMKSTYADGTDEPRRASDGSDLPSTRLVSARMLHNAEIQNMDVTYLFMTMGQFLDHDLTLTPTVTGANGSGIVCCNDTLKEQNLLHPACFPIRIPNDDPFFSQFRLTCMEFVRSSPGPRKDCSLGPREQMNQLTSYIDASQVYGSSQALADSLRSNVGGKLKTSFGKPGREFPPTTSFPGCTTDEANGLGCFLAGDSRITEQSQLTTLHIIFLREHNRIADELHLINPAWNDDKLYEEVRRIVIAKWQHMVFNELVPLILGEPMLEKFDLKLLRNGRWDFYDDTLDATIFNEFAAAAYRFGHSTVPTLINLFAGTFKVGTQLLRHQYLATYETKLINEYVNGLTQQFSMKTDNQLTKEVTEHLFEQPSVGWGLDLPALNMQRGRDHAIGTYNQARVLCGLSRVNNFTDLRPIMFPTVATKLAGLYKTADDIDLWLGGVCERPLPRATVGPTFACIIGEQFRRSRKGDRLWYERGPDQGTRFTAEQLAELRKTSMARVLCDNSDIEHVQPLALLKNTARWNKIVKCNDLKSIPSPSLEPWKE